MPTPPPREAPETQAQRTVFHELLQAQVKGEGR